MSKTSLRFCVVCWLTMANQPSGGSVLFTHSAQLNHPLPSPNTLSYSRYVLGSIHLRLESIRKTEQLLKILRLSGITLATVFFSVSVDFRNVNGSTVYSITSVTPYKYWSIVSLAGHLQFRPPLRPLLTHSSVTWSPLIGYIRILSPPPTF